MRGVAVRARAGQKPAQPQVRYTAQLDTALLAQMRTSCVNATRCAMGAHVRLVDLGASGVSWPQIGRGAGASRRARVAHADVHVRHVRER